ncbi:MAG: glycosyltransferase, partial [Myxococcota bacterium]
MDKRPQNLRRTFKKWRRRLVQDDFAYQVPLSAKTGRRFAIKIGVPDRTQSHWGDIYFAEGLAKALCRQGHECEIHYLCEWGQPDRDIDVVVHIKGLSEYVPKPHNVNVMWMINHPDRHRDDELERYDLVCVASEPYARELQGRLRVPVLYLPQATEPDRFRPGATRDLELVFVGSNRGVGRKSMRRVIADLLPTRHRLAVWGDGWDGLLPDGVWQGPFVANDALPEIYGRAHVVLNDHHDDMRAAGFINNRTFDALACGAFVVSDAVPGLDAFDAVYTYRSRDELRSAVDALMKLPPPTERHVESFEDRARRLAEETVELQSRPASAE